MQYMSFNGDLQGFRARHFLFTYGSYLETVVLLPDRGFAYNLGRDIQLHTIIESQIRDRLEYPILVVFNSRGMAPPIRHRLQNGTYTCHDEDNKQKVKEDMGGQDGSRMSKNASALLQ